MSWAESPGMSWRSQKTDFISTWSRKGDWGKAPGSRAGKILAGCSFLGGRKMDFTICLFPNVGRGVLPGYRGWWPTFLRYPCQHWLSTCQLWRTIPGMCGAWHLQGPVREWTRDRDNDQNPHLLSVEINTHKFVFSTWRPRIRPVRPAHMELWVRDHLRFFCHLKVFQTPLP